MYLSKINQISRRAFLTRSAQLAVTGAALPTALNLAAIGEAAAIGATDYKALVCVFLFGGNDYANTLVPFDQLRYQQYAKIRGDGRTDGTPSGIALGINELSATKLIPNNPFTDQIQYALHPKMTGLADLFDRGQAAVQLNVGPLIVPTTRSDFNSLRVPLPPKLFSHNDHQSIWQSSEAEGAVSGWGGRMADLALTSNFQSLFTCISVSGSAVFLSGQSALAYQTSTEGSIKLNAITNKVYNSEAVKKAIGQLIRQPAYSDLLEVAHVNTAIRSIDSESLITSALLASKSNADNNQGVYMPFSVANNSLGNQLKMVARLIAAKDTLQNKRQVFFVSLGGFDNHDLLLGSHNTLLERVSSSMTAFHETMVNLGISDKVTAFTASDFGRTLTSNGDGSDHGWGNHHFVVGGAVKGKAFYGKAPPISVGNSSSDSNDQWHVGQGRLLPSTSVDQYAATLAHWFGISSSDLPTVLPNLINFGDSDYPTNLGFMQTT